MNKRFKLLQNKFIFLRNLNNLKLSNFGVVALKKDIAKDVHVTIKAFEFNFLNFSNSYSKIIRMNKIYNINQKFYCFNNIEDFKDDFFYYLKNHLYFNMVFFHYNFYFVDDNIDNRLSYRHQDIYYLILIKILIFIKNFLNFK